MAVDRTETPYERFQRIFAKYENHYLSQEGLCFYCRQPMAVPDPIGETGGPLPPDRVTVEHLITLSERRRMNAVAVQEQRPRPTVAACNACNRERGAETSWREFLIMKIEELWAPK